MTVTIELIRDLHHKHTLRADLERQQKRLPLQISAAEASVAESAARIEQQTEQIKQKNVNAEAKQLQLREREDKITKLKGNQNAAKSNREYQTLKDQIEADEQANSVLSDEILEMLEEIDVDREKLITLKKQHELIVADAQNVRERLEERQAIVAKDLQRVLAELEATEKNVSGDLREKYFRMVASQGENAMAPLEGNCCGGCNTMLSPQTVNTVQMGKPIPCTSCGVILYLDN